MGIKQVAWLMSTTLLLSGCGALLDSVDEASNGPKLASLEAPMKKNDYRPIKWPEEQPVGGYAPGPQNVNSLWEPGNRSFFKDARARRVGDILRVIVQINDKAEVGNETERTRDSSNSVGASSIFGLEKLLVGWLPGKADPTSLIDTNSSSSHKGKGTADREEKITTQVAAIVTQILPNGNIVISGDQEIQVNHEIRKVTVSGIVRPEDISADNSIDSNLIAEARISYGGRGELTDAQSARIGHKIIDAVSPF
jgi:flagellar L-ring protein precursor FlgH